MFWSYRSDVFVYVHDDNIKCTWKFGDCFSGLCKCRPLLTRCAPHSVLRRWEHGGRNRKYLLALLPVCSLMIGVNWRLAKNTHQLCALPWLSNCSMVVSLHCPLLLPCSNPAPVRTSSNLWQIEAICKKKNSFLLCLLKDPQCFN